jgi:hypothetical protein
MTMRMENPRPEKGGENNKKIPVNQEEVDHRGRQQARV